MTLSKSDFPHIVWSVLTFVLALVLASSAIIASEHFLTRSRAEQQAAQRQLSEARNQLATAQADRDNMKTYTLEYGSLLERNLIGHNQRLDWIEGLANLQRQGRVLDFKYTIAPQQIYTPVPPLDSGNFDLYLSTMTLQFNLLHEGQLINFFEALRTHLKGWFVIERCTLERGNLATEPANFSSLAQLKGDCSGGWLTLKNRNEK